MEHSDAQATFCATLVDEWTSSGVVHAVIAPGSRSTPIAVVLAEQLRVHVVHDERSAAFCALGIGVGGTPAVLLCTSGTAAANLHPAVVEASLSDVPMLVVTADRPPELRDVGAPQTIDQTRLYGVAARWFHDPGVADAAASGSWRSLARRALRAALGGSAARPGPVHLNLPFREPLLGRPGPLPPTRPAVPEVETRRIGASSTGESMGGVGDAVGRRHGVIVAGGRSGVDADHIAALASALSWPLLADPCSGARHLPMAVPAFDAILRHERFAADHRPDVVIRLGRPPASKVLAHWVAGSGAPVVQVGGPGVIDPGHDVSAVLPPASVEHLAAGVRGASDTAWLNRWLNASGLAEQAIDDCLASHAALSEPQVARTLAEWLPDDHQLVVASSMPVRDLEWYGGCRARAHANRGANGIDGVVATALGLTLDTGRPVVAVVGDIAMVHDSSALAGIVTRGVDLRIVVVDNDGGGIFSFLPQAAELTVDRFEQLFGTPHGTDLEYLAAAHGVPATTVTTVQALQAAVAERGSLLIRVPSERARNVAVHDELHTAVGAALAGGPGGTGR